MTPGQVQRAVAQETREAWAAFCAARRAAQLAVKRHSGLRRGVKGWTKRPEAVQRAKARRKGAARDFLPVAIEGMPTPDKFGLFPLAEIKKAKQTEEAAEVEEARVSISSIVNRILSKRGETLLSVRKIRRRLRGAPSVGGKGQTGGRTPKLFHGSVIRLVVPEVFPEPAAVHSLPSLLELAEQPATEGVENPFVEAVKRRRCKTVRP